MRDILITGGIGEIGFDLVNQLLETNCNITILDLESKKNIDKMKAIKDRVRIVYGDVGDVNLVRDLVKRNDIVIHYAGIMPPLANLNANISNEINYLGTKNIVDSINETNPECVLLYMSFISVYGSVQKSKRVINVETESTHPDDAYTVSLIRSEEYLKSNLKKYCILRMPIVLTSNNYFIKHMVLNKMTDFIAKEDLNAIIINIMKSKNIHGKVFNISGFKTNSSLIAKKLYKETGQISLFNRKLYFGEFEDKDKIEKIYKAKYTKLEDIKIEKNRFWLQCRKFINLPKYWIFLRMSKSKK